MIGLTCAMALATLAGDHPDRGRKVYERGAVKIAIGSGNLFGYQRVERYQDGTVITFDDVSKMAGTLTIEYPTDGKPMRMGGGEWDRRIRLHHGKRSRVYMYDPRTNTLSEEKP